LLGASVAASRLVRRTIGSPPHDVARATRPVSTSEALGCGRVPDRWRRRGAVGGRYRAETRVDLKHHPGAMTGPRVAANHRWSRHGESLEGTPVGRGRPRDGGDNVGRRAPRVIAGHSSANQQPRRPTARAAALGVACPVGRTREQASTGRGTDGSRTVQSATRRDHIDLLSPST
jgi:hypothetical protein